MAASQKHIMSMCTALIGSCQSLSESQELASKHLAPVLARWPGKVQLTKQLALLCTLDLSSMGLAAGPEAVGQRGREGD